MFRKASRRYAVRISAGIAAALLLTGVMYWLRFNLSSATSVHLFLIAAVAIKWGFPEASIVSVASVGCLDYFFTEPLRHFYMSDSHDWVALVTFESVALVVSRLSTQLTRHADESEANRSKLQRLYDLGQQILLCNLAEPIEPQLAVLIKSALSARGVALWNAYNLRHTHDGMCAFTKDDLRSTFFAGYDEDDNNAHNSRRVLRSGTRPIGALIIQEHMADEALVNAVSSLVAIALERARSFAEESRSEAAKQSEQLRATVLDALAHAFKTPLTVIQASSSGLLEMNTLPPTERKLVSLIDRQATHLSEITTTLLRTAKFDHSILKLRRQEIDLVELVQESIAESSERFSESTIDVTAAASVVTAFADRHLLKMALLQLVENAAQYGESGGAIHIEVETKPEESRISVHNRGSFIPFEERDQIFRRFYRSPDLAHKAPGSGIGLSVVKQVIEAHGGSVWVTSEVQGETAFFMTIPCRTH